MTVEQIKKTAEENRAELLEIRRHIHAHPELSFQEFETSTYVKSVLQKWSIPYTEGWVKTGIVGEIGNGNGPVLALRADLDALPIQEENTHEYRSTNEGVMHACGHDVHTTSLLGAAKILKSFESEINGTIRLIFQPAEERLPGGAKLMLEEKALGEILPEKIIGQHVFPDLEVGKVGFKTGMYMASCDEIFLTVKGKGGHAALPHTLNDTVLATSHIIVALQQIVSRNRKPDIPAVLSFGRVIAEGATNIIPAEVNVAGTMRTFDEVWRYKAHDRIREIAEQTARANGCTCEVKIDVGYPFLKNDEQVTALSKRAAEAYLGKENVVDLDMRMTAEDFSYYSQVIPGCFYRLGTRNEAKGITHGLHTSRFDIDEDALPIGAGLMAWMALEQLREK